MNIGIIIALTNRRKDKYQKMVDSREESKRMFLTLFAVGGLTVVIILVTVFRIWAIRDPKDLG